MNTCVTRALAAGIALAFAGTAAADPLELRAEATAGVRLYDLEHPYDDDVTGFFDQYRHIRDKDDALPFFADLLHLDLGLARDDDTWLLRLERWSHNALNERTLFDADWRGFSFELEARRYRSEELRFYPVGTDGAFPAFGVEYNSDLGVPDDPDATAAAVLDNDARLDTKRTSVGGELRVRLDEAGAANPAVAEAALYSRFERREGHNLDTFLLDEGREPTLDPRAAWRGNRRELDQKVTTVGARLVTPPLAGFTTAVDANFEAFREDAPILTTSDLAARDPDIVAPPAFGVTDRDFFFVPDTNRLTGEAAFSGRLYGATLHGGGYVTQLDQTGRRELSQNQVTTWTAHAGFDLPLAHELGANGYAKVVRRTKDLNTANFDARTRNIDGTTGGQTDSFLRSRTEITAGLEGTFSPMLGTLLGAGYRLRYVDRNLRQPPPSGISEPVSLVRGDTETHTAYLRGRSRLGRGLRVSGEAGWISSPQVGFVRDWESAWYAEGRGGYSIGRPFPVSLSAYGHYRDGRNRDIELSEDNARAKTLERTEWNYGVSLAASPVRPLSLFASFDHAHDEQEFNYLRSTIPRYGDASNPLFMLSFFDDSFPLYESDVRTLTTGATVPLTKRLDFTASTALTWVSLTYDGGGNTPALLEAVNELDTRILSLEGRLDARVSEAVRVGFGYRFDDFEESQERDPLRLDTKVHTFTADLTIEFQTLLP